MSSPSYETMPKLTGFFRPDNANVAVFARRLAKPLAQSLGANVLRVADIGTSSGKATWTTAAGLALHKELDFHIDGFEVDEEMYRQTTLPYRGTIGNLRELLRTECVDPTYRPDLLKHFRPVRGGRIQPSSHLRARVDFHHSDALTEQLPEETFHVGVATNMLYHHSPRNRHRLMQSILGGIVEGGLFIPEMPSAVPSQRREYDQWYSQLTTRYPLAPVVPEVPDVFPGIYRKVA